MARPNEPAMVIDTALAAGLLVVVEADAAAVDVRDFLAGAVRDYAYNVALNHRLRAWTSDTHAFYREAFIGVMIRRVNDFFRDGDKISKRPAIDGGGKKGGDHVS